ncbi:MAG: hypothetical protein FWE24_11230 [Defluviitaleaceae bacterium]|nr:hypothetical protein [Defluviitaleaceae bacterium]
MRKIYFAVCLAMMLLLTSCASWDLIGIGAVEAFDRVINSENVRVENTDIGWVLNMPDGNASLSLDRDGSTSRISFQEYTVRLIDGNVLWMGASFEFNTTEYETEMTPLTIFKQILHYRPEFIGYHDTGHHYMLHFGDSGNMLMFARDIASQEAGVVFMLNPEQFIEAGVDVHNIDGWHFGPHETMTIRGQTVTRDFLVKTFDLR